MSNGKNLDTGGNVPENDMVREAGEGHATKLWGLVDSVRLGREAGFSGCNLKGGVVAHAQTSRFLFVVSDLIFVLPCRFRVKLVAHSRIALIRLSSSSSETRFTSP